MQYKLLTLTSRDAAPESHQVRPESLKTLERGGGSYFPYILSNEIQTMFSQLAKR